MKKKKKFLEFLLFLDFSFSDLIYVFPERASYTYRYLKGTQNSILSSVSLNDVFQIKYEIFALPRISLALPDESFAVWACISLSVKDRRRSDQSKMLQKNIILLGGNDDN